MLALDAAASDAHKAGEREERIHQLSAWEESSLCTARERAALALTEGVTRLPEGVPDAVYDEAARPFEEREPAQLITLVFTVNVWNRMNVTSGRTPGTE